MLPTTLYATDLNGVETQAVYSDVHLPSKTYRIDWEHHRMTGMVDAVDAEAQAAAKILMTERWAYPIYDGQYGVELDSLMGQPFAYAAAHLEPTVTQALTADDRLLSVENFALARTGADTARAMFDIRTTEGTVQEGVEIHGLT